ncbi:hypothetical protein LCGC14_2806550, partial [marine sediment metagenome]
MMLSARGQMYERFDDARLRVGTESLRPAFDHRWLMPLLVIDAALILVHAVAGYLMPTIPPLLNIARDFSLGEIFGYFKWMAIVAILLLCFARTRLPVLLAMAAVFALMEKAVNHPKHCNDFKGVWHDVLWMSRCHKTRRISESCHLFMVIITG